MTIAPSGSEKMYSSPKKKMAPSGPPCSQQLPAQTKVNSKRYEADIKKMISAARLAHADSNGEIPACCHPHHPRKLPPEQRPPVLRSQLLHDVLRQAGQQRHGSLRQEEAQRIHTRPRQ